MECARVCTVAQWKQLLEAKLGRITHMYRELQADAHQEREDHDREIYELKQQHMRASQHMQLRHDQMVTIGSLMFAVSCACMVLV